MLRQSHQGALATRFVRDAKVERGARGEVAALVVAGLDAFCGDA